MLRLRMARAQCCCCTGSSAGLFKAAQQRLQCRAQLPPPTRAPNGHPQHLVKGPQHGALARNGRSQRRFPHAARPASGNNSGAAGRGAAAKQRRCHTCKGIARRPRPVVRRQGRGRQGLTRGPSSGAVKEAAAWPLVKLRMLFLLLLMVLLLLLLLRRRRRRQRRQRLMRL